MVVYILYGFRWSRTGHNSQAPGIRAHIVSYNLLDAAAEYLQEPATEKDILGSFKRIDPNIPYHLPELRIIEQYDPEDTSDAALSQPFAYITAKVFTLPDGDSQSKRILSLNLDDITSKGPELSEDGAAALSRLRDFLAPDEKVGWWIVYNGDPERDYPETTTESVEDREEEKESSTMSSEGVHDDREKPTVQIQACKLFVDKFTDPSGSSSRATGRRKRNPNPSSKKSFGSGKSNNPPSHLDAVSVEISPETQALQYYSMQAFGRRQGTAAVSFPSRTYTRSRI